MYTRPVRILWKFPAAAIQAADPNAWIDFVPSKSTRKLARNLDSILADSSLTFVIRPLTEELYAEWYEMYTALMLSQNHDVLAKPSWFADRHTAFREVNLVELLSTKDSHRAGASIITCTAQDVWSKPYRASERVEFTGHRNLSAGALLDLLSLRYIFSRNPSAVHSGSSRNAFGHFNNLGYLAYKLKMGYQPWILPDYPIDAELPQTTPDTPTAWFVTPPEYAGEVVRLQTLVVSPSQDVLNDELRTYVAHHGISIQVR